MKNHKYGFTLIELLVVVLIIGILAAVAVPQYQKAVDKARFARAKAALKGMQAAQQVYYMENNAFSDKLSNLDLPPDGCSLQTDDTICSYKWGYCYLACTPTGSCGGCLLNLTSTETAIYISQLGWDQLSCYATPTSARANQLCRSETGRDITYEGSYNIYFY